jgi:uncharacterized repeat protein (TIGR03803 family)
LLAFFFISVTTIISPAQTVNTLNTFNQANGRFPTGVLVEGRDHNFYGTTAQGGANDFGTVFKVTAGGTITILHNFNLDDGSGPLVGLVAATNGNFYGTTYGGGSSYFGTVFKITPSGTFTSLYSFTGGSDGNNPLQLIQASDGNFYGVADGGGIREHPGYGVIYTITPQGAFRKIYQFDGNNHDGTGPDSLIQGSDGSFYGTTVGDGIACASLCGTVFKVTSIGDLTTLHNFRGSDGSAPSGQLLQTSNGNFYGTTRLGGDYDKGTVFRITPSGALTVLHNFCQQYDCPDGGSPWWGLMQANDGTLYGTTWLGGVYGSCGQCGTIFTISPDGDLTTLFSFDGVLDGGYPNGLLQASDGSFYGSTNVGGSNYDGTVFRFFPTGKTLYTSVVGNGAVASTDGIISCPGTCAHVYTNDSRVTLNATPAGGWTFTGWSGACTGTSSCNVDLTQDQIVSAHFLPLVTLTVTTDGNGSVVSTDGFINCPGICSHGYAQYTQVTLSPIPAIGWSFNHWTAPCLPYFETCPFEMASDLTANATFTQDSYTLTTSLTGQGTVTSTDGFINCPGRCRYVSVAHASDAECESRARLEIEWLERRLHRTGPLQSRNAARLGSIGLLPSAGTRAGISVSSGRALPAGRHAAER